MRNCIITLAVLAFVALSLPVGAEEVFELVAPVRGYDPTWAPDSTTTWHTLHPPELFCTNGVQTDHDDVDGDGMMSFCDNIQIDGVWKHIEWVGPTIRIRYLENGRAVKYIEPVEVPGRQFQYHEVSPIYCNLIETTEPIEYVCQEVWIEFPPEDVGWWHVEAIETNIRTNGGSPVENPSTWSQIKNWFRKLIR